jgi:branched-chain amino acid transport system substrate-binding protein
MRSFLRLLCLFFLLVPPTGCQRGKSGEVLIIGHLAPLSGTDKAMGQAERQGIMLAVEEVNKSGGLDGRRVEVRHVDTRGDSSTLQNEAVRLVTINRTVGLIGGENADQAERLARAIQSYGIPVVTLNGLPSAADNECVFSINVSAVALGQELARAAAEQDVKASRFGVVHDEEPGYAAIAAAFRKELVKKEGTQITEQAFKGEADFASLLEQLKRSPPEAIMLSATPRAALKLRRVLSDGGVTVPIFYGGDEGLDRLLPGESANQGALYALTSFAEDAGSTSKEFAKTFRERFGQEPDVLAASAYDAARLLFDALRQTKPLELARLRKALAETANFEGLSGPFSMSKDHSAKRPLFLTRWQNGQTRTTPAP